MSSHSRPGRLYVCEGVDGVGKSDLARLLSEELGARLYKTPPPGYVRDHPIPPLTPVTPEGMSARFRYFIRAMEAAAHDIRGILSGGEDVVADRWVWTTMAYHFVLHPPLRGRWPSELTWISDLPSVAFLIDVPDPGLWVARLQGRGSNSAADTFSLSHLQQLLQVKAEFTRLDRALEPINNTDTRQASLDQMLAAIQRLEE